MARPKTGKTGKPTNLYLAVEIKLQGTKIAHERPHLGRARARRRCANRHRPPA